MGFPVSHDPDGRYALRLLRSVDFPVSRLVIVLNMQELADPPWLLEALRLQPKLDIVRPKTNLGCAGGWNSVIEAAPFAAYWLICNNDVAFVPGALARIATRMAAASAAEVANASLKGSACGDVAAPGCGGSPGKPPLPVLMWSFAVRGGTLNLPAFVLTRRAVAEVGLFDENFWPVYGEDTDYFNRLWLLGHGMHIQDLTVEVVHGPDGWDDDVSGHYSGSEQFIRSDTGKDLDEQAVVLAMQLQAADNGHHACMKYGPVHRPVCADLDYAEAGPYGVTGASWADWVLDPFRRMCSMSGGVICGLDLRLVGAQLA